MPERQPDLTCFRWTIDLSAPEYREAERIVSEHCAPALTAARDAVKVDSAYVAKHVQEATVWLTLFATLRDAVPLVNAVTPFLGGLKNRQQIISDLAREELLQSHCDSFRAALDLVTRVALDVHAHLDLAAHQRALVTIGVLGRSNRTELERYLGPRSATFRGLLRDPQELSSVLSCNCLTGQPTDALHWLYNIILGFDWEWRLGEAVILSQLGL
jgi:hypothetical protein